MACFGGHSVRDLGRTAERVPQKTNKNKKRSAHRPPLVSTLPPAPRPLRAPPTTTRAHGVSALHPTPPFTTHHRVQQRALARRLGAHDGDALVGDARTRQPRRAGGGIGRGSVEGAVAVDDLGDGGGHREKKIEECPIAQHTKKK